MLCKAKSVLYGMDAALATDWLSVSRNPCGITMVVTYKVSLGGPHRRGS